MMDKKEEKKKFKFSEIFTNKQYRAIAILVFYAILFVVLIISIRTPKGNGLNDIINNKTKLEGYELIDNNNFGYKYTVTMDDNIYYYEGKKYQNKELLTVTVGEEKREYYFEGDNVYLKENNYYNFINIKPYILFDFFDTDINKALILRSIKIQESSNRYTIDNQKIYDVISNSSTKIVSGENYIDLVYRNDNITGIRFDFSNYTKTVGEGYNNIIVALEYYDFNLIDDFNIVVSQ